MTPRFFTFLFITVPNILWATMGIAFTIHKCKEYAEKPFVCPNCGNSFPVRPARLLWGIIPLLAIKKSPLKCPHCDRTDLCRWKEEAP